MRSTYFHGGYPDQEVEWGAPLVDLTGYDIVVTVFPFGGAVAFTKNTGFTIPALVDGVVQSPNLVVTWSTDPDVDLDGLADGTYVERFVATQTSFPTLEWFEELVIRVNAPNFGYCELSDLMLGDLPIPPGINPYDFINSAADEMDSDIGQRYTLPLNLALAPSWVASKVRMINAKLATGQLLMAQAQAGEDKQLHAYGKYLADEAKAELAAIKCGEQNLPGLTRDPTSILANAPETINHDAASAVDAFENFAQRRNVFWPTLSERWRPGAT